MSLLDGRRDLPQACPSLQRKHRSDSRLLPWDRAQVGVLTAALDAIPEGGRAADVSSATGLGRRQFAMEMKHAPLRDLCELGGWKSPQTVLTCYQRADSASMQQALAARRRFEA